MINGNRHNVLTMSLNEYQKDAAEFAIYSWPIVYTALGLCSESGELCGKIKKHIRDSKLKFDGSTRELTEAEKGELVAEAGDCLWYVSQFLKDIGVSMNDCAMQNLVKLASRQRSGTLGGSGDNR